MMRFAGQTVQSPECELYDYPPEWSSPGFFEAHHSSTASTWRLEGVLRNWRYARRTTKPALWTEMDAPRNIDLRALEARLNVRAPRAYVDFVNSSTNAALARQGFDPKTVLVLNLELRDSEHYDDIHERFFLSGDGCGNYYFVDLAGDQDKVLLWAHDPPGIEDPNARLASFLPDAEQDRRIDRPINAGDLYICRTQAYAESMLEPIRLDEWIAAVNSTAGLKYVGYREGMNPFTHQAIRIESPGLTVVNGQDGLQISFFHGRATAKDSAVIRPLARTLARKLGAHLLGVASNE